MADLIDVTTERMSAESSIILEGSETKNYFDKYGGNGTGICENCDKAIPERRLWAIPGAKYCVKCQDLADNNKL